MPGISIDPDSHCIEGAAFELDFQKFPKCIPKELTLPLKNGLPVKIHWISEPTEEELGFVVVAFKGEWTDTIKIAEFLYEWDKCRFDPITGKQETFENLKAVIKIVDKNGIKDDIQIIVENFDDVNTGPPPNFAVEYSYT